MALIVNTHPIEGYSDKLSYFPGDLVKLKVHSPRPQFSIDLIRIGASVNTLLTVPDIPGFPQNYHTYSFQNGCGWVTTYRLTIPMSAPSGMYSVRLYDDTGNQWFITFIVKDPNPSLVPSIAILSSTNTWQAYNDWGGASLYNYEIPDGSGKPYASIVNFQRPNNQTNPLLDVGTAASGEKYIYSWFEQRGYRYSAITDWDLNKNPSILKSFRILVINTHPEYWTAPMYDALDTFLNTGGSLVSLTGNSIFWKAVIKGNQMEVRKDLGIQQLDGTPGGRWDYLGRPAAAVLGVGFEDIDADLPTDFSPYEVLQANHWVFTGTGLQNGDLIGSSGLNRGGASGWEVDKITPDSPANTIFLAEGTNANGRGGNMVYYDHPAGGGVFAVGSISFGGSLVVDAQLSKIVENVLQKFTTNI